MPEETLCYLSCSVSFIIDSIFGPPAVAQDTCSAICRALRQAKGSASASTTCPWAPKWTCTRRALLAHPRCCPQAALRLPSHLCASCSVAHCQHTSATWSATGWDEYSLFKTVVCSVADFIEAGVDVLVLMSWSGCMGRSMSRRHFQGLSEGCRQGCHGHGAMGAVTCRTGWGTLCRPCSCCQATWRQRMRS